MGGSISVESKVGKGTVFNLVFGTKISMNLGMEESE
jgi:chemotaxis protein histidine kinase CheA